MPAFLQNLIAPPARIAELSDFDRSHRAQRIEDVVRQVALHETGHAVAWALNGGTLERTTIVPESDEGCVQWGLTTYDVTDEPSVKERRRKALAANRTWTAILRFFGTPRVWRT